MEACSSDWDGRSPVHARDPLFAQMGAGYSVIIVTFLSAWLGTYVYGRFRDSLPH